MNAIYLRTNLAVGAALPIAARVATAADPATNNRAPAAITAAFAIEAGLVFLAAIVVCGITILAADIFTGTAKLRPRKWLKAHCIREREAVLAACARPHGVAGLASAALPPAARARAALFAAAALSSRTLAPARRHSRSPAESEEECQTTPKRTPSGSERTHQCVESSVVHGNLLRG